MQIYEKDLDKVKKTFDLKSKEDEEKLDLRLNCALNWLENYAPEDFKFSVQKEVPILKLDKELKEALHKVADALAEDFKDDVALHEKMYGIINDMGVKPGEFFKAAYQVLIN